MKNTVAKADERMKLQLTSTTATLRANRQQAIWRRVECKSCQRSDSSSHAGRRAVTSAYTRLLPGQSCIKNSRVARRRNVMMTSPQRHDGVAATSWWRTAPSPKCQGCTTFLLMPAASPVLLEDAVASEFSISLFFCVASVFLPHTDPSLHTHVCLATFLPQV